MTPNPGVAVPPIAIIGKAGAGKTTGADILTETAGYARLSHAAPLKEAAVLLYGPGSDTDRGLLQKLGQHLRAFDEDIFVKALGHKIAAALEAGERVVVDDCRFPNEVRALMGRGFMFVRVAAERSRRVDRLRRNGKLQDEAQLEDTSETAIDWFEPHYELANDAERGSYAEELLWFLNREAS